LRGKKSSSQLLEGIRNSFEAEKNSVLEKLVKISLRDISQEERIQEASKPLYLKRYE